MEFPVDIEIEDSLASLIKKLLKKKVSERLCNFKAIKFEKLFENFNFVINKNNKNKNKIYKINKLKNYFLFFSNFSKKLILIFQRDLEEYLLKPPFMPENQKLDFLSIKKFKYLDRINKVNFFLINQLNLIEKNENFVCFI